MTLKDAGEAFLIHCQLERHLSANTLAAYRQDIGELTVHFGEAAAGAVTGRALVAYSAYLSATRALAPATVKRRIACTRGLFRWLERTAVIVADPFIGTEIRIRVPDRLPRCLSTAEMALLARQTEAASAVTRMATLLLFATGMRVGELVTVRLSDVDFEGGTIRIVGKGDRQRQVIIPNEQVGRLIRDYIRDHHPDRSATDRLLRDPGGRSLSTAAIRVRLRRLAEDVGLSRKVTPQMLRHTAATAGRSHDLRRVWASYGHARCSRIDAGRRLYSTAAGATWERTVDVGLCDTIRESRHRPARKGYFEVSWRQARRSRLSIRKTAPRAPLGDQIRAAAIRVQNSRWMALRSA